MIMQCLSKFPEDAFGQAALADQNQRMKVMTQASQVLLLTIRECHELIIGPQAGNRS